MSRLVNPDTGTVVSVQGDLEARYRARGWAEHGSQPAKVKATPDKPSDDDDTDKPVTRRNTRRK